MVKLGSVSLNGTPRVAVSFKDGVSPKTLAVIRNSGVSVAELRVDQFRSWKKDYVLGEFQRYRSFAVIATIRSRREGGAWRGREEDRLNLFLTLLPKVDAVDIELTSSRILSKVVRAAQRLGKKVLISYHHFSRTPGNAYLESVISRAKKSGADLVKIATCVSKADDMRRLAALTLSHEKKNLIVIAMGKRGISSRVLFPALGSLLTYACVGKPMAPGQMDYRKTLAWIKAFYPV